MFYLDFGVLIAFLKANMWFAAAVCRAEDLRRGSTQHLDLPSLHGELL